MSKKLQLSIPTPCHENWDAMTPVENARPDDPVGRGKFCGSCQKQVVDFSNMSDRQVAAFFKKPSTGSVCGRFMSDQLERDIEIPRKRIPWLKYFFQFAIPAFLVSIKVSAEKTQGKIKVKTETKDTLRRPLYEQLMKVGMIVQPISINHTEKIIVDTPVAKQIVPLKGDIKVVGDTIITQPVCTGDIMGEIAIPVQSKKNKIEGIVVDEKGEPVPFASIESGKPGEGIMADENGCFVIKKSWLNNGSSLFFSSTGFESKKILFGEEEYLSGKLFVQLKANGILKEVVVKSDLSFKGESYRLGGAVACYFIKGNKEIIKPTPAVEENSLVIYPNPVHSGAPLNFSFKNHDESYYQLQLLNQSGQSIHHQDIWIDAEARVLSMDIPFVAAGSYFLVLSNKKSGKRFTEKIIVQ